MHQTRFGAYHCSLRTSFHNRHPTQFVFVGSRPTLLSTPDHALTFALHPTIVFLPSLDFVAKSQQHFSTLVAAG